MTTLFLRKLPLLLGRLALVFCFLSFGFWEVFQTSVWINFVPPFMANMIDPMMIVRTHGIVMIIVALGLLTGFMLRVFVGIAVLLLIEIVTSLWISSGFSDILVRDATILIFAIALFVQTFVPERQ